MIQKDLLSATISNLRFPLMIGIVLIHSKIGGGDFEHLCSDILPSACVPIFFMMSAFLFFYDWKGGMCDFSDTTPKLKKRLTSLVVPYLFWISLTIGIFAALHIFVPSMINPDFENVPEWGWQNYLTAYWNGSGGFPISYPLWFLRNLIVMTYCAPVFYLLVYKMRFVRWIALLGFTIMYFMDDSGTVMGLFYFYCGVLLAWWLNSGHVIKHNILYPVWFASCAIFILLVVLDLCNISLFASQMSLMRLVESVCLIGIFVKLTKTGLKVPNWLGECSFFIYLFHALPLLVISRVLVGILHPASALMLIVAYLLNITIIVVVSIAAYYILKKIFPRVTSFITGGR